MIFSSFEFLVFFIAIYLAFWLLPSRRWRHVLLLGASYYFYMSWNPYFISLIIISTVVDYTVGRALKHCEARKRRKVLLTSSVVVNLSILGIFKYANFFVDNVVDSLNALGFHADPVALGIILPVGISFYTFQTMSYTIDVYRGILKPSDSFVEFALFVAFFPQLVAGPIVRARYFLPQLLTHKRFNREDLAAGLRIFALGFFKKCFISDRISPFVDEVFANPDPVNSAGIWLAVVLYAIQIYCDFSGYSDMAIGCAKMLGFRLPENFRMPYFAKNITDFWRRWHISLSTWLRDYLYIPLGGNHGSMLFQRRNLLLTMLLGGLWHGASWNFVFWGMLHGLYLVIHKAFVAWRGDPDEKPATVWNRLLGVLSGLFTFYVVCLTWVFFRAQTFDVAWHMIGKMLFLTDVGQVAVNPWLYGVIGIVLAAHITASVLDLGKVWIRTPIAFKAMTWTAFALLVFLFTPFDPQPFVYFQF